MRLTIIKSDGIVSIDGRSIMPIDCSSLNGEWNILQWDGTSGHLQYPQTPGAEFRPNDLIETMDDPTVLALVAIVVQKFYDIDNPDVTTIPALTNYARLKRKNKELGGFTLNGMPIATDDRSKMMVMGARIKADKDPTFTTQWDGGDIFQLNAAQIIAISDAVLDHVDNCFTIYATVKGKIENETITDKEAIDTAFA